MPSATPSMSVQTPASPSTTPAVHASAPHLRQAGDAAPFGSALRDALCSALHDAMACSALHDAMAIHPEGTAATQAGIATSPLISPPAAPKPSAPTAAIALAAASSAPSGADTKPAVGTPATKKATAPASDSAASTDPLQPSANDLVAPAVDRPSAMPAAPATIPPAISPPGVQGDADEPAWTADAPGDVPITTTDTSGGLSGATATDAAAMADRHPPAVPSRLAGTTVVDSPADPTGRARNTISTIGPSLPSQAMAPSWPQASGSVALSAGPDHHPVKLPTGTGSIIPTPDNPANAARSIVAQTIRAAGPAIPGTNTPGAPPVSAPSGGNPSLGNPSLGAATLDLAQTASINPGTAVAGAVTASVIMQPSPSTSTPALEASAAGSPTKLSAAAQIAPAFAALSAPAAAGGKTLLIQLAPSELGHVQIRIDKSSDGSSHVVVAVERSDTLMTLIQDRPQLNQALDAAGIPPEGRTLQFNLAEPGAGNDQAGFVDDNTQSGFASNNGGTGSGTGAGAGSGRSFSGGDTGGGSQRPPVRTAWQRAGIDITA